MKRRFTFTVLSLVFLVWSCEPEIDPDTLHAGDLTIESYIAIGDAFTAGFANGGIYRESQELSYPSLLVQQIREIKQVPFNQPLMGDLGTGFFTLEQVKEASCSDSRLIPTLAWQSEDFSMQENIASRAPFHNLGITGLTLNQIDQDDLAQQIPFFKRMVGQDIGITYLNLLDQVRGNLFSVWLGLEEVLKFARSGLTRDSIQAESVEEFGQNLEKVIHRIFENDPQSTILLGDIPDVVSFPFFSSLSHTYTDTLGCQEQAIFVEAHSTPKVIRVREATSNDKILLSASGLIGTPVEGGLRLGLSPDTPLPDSLVLDEQEVQQVRALIAGFNQKIQDLINVNREIRNYPYIVADVNLSQQLNNALQGQTLDGLDVSGVYLTGGLFSLDGLSFSPRGNSLVANFFVQSLNQNFTAQIPQLNITDFEGVVFP